MSHFRPASGTRLPKKNACGFDRSELYSDDRPPIGEMAVEPRVEAASEIEAASANRGLGIAMVLEGGDLIPFCCGAEALH